MTLLQGGASYPLVAQSTGQALVKVADPWLYQALPFYQFAINNYLAAAYTAVMAGKSTAAANAACVTTLAVNPIPFLEAGVVQRPPALAVFPVKGQWEQRTTQRDHTKDEYGLVYILPGVTFDQWQLLSPFLSAVRDVLMLTHEQQADPGYTPQATTATPSPAQGSQVWLLTGSEFCRFTDWEIGFVESASATGHYMPLLSAHIEVGWEDRYNPAAGLTYLYTLSQIGIGQADTGIFPDAIESRTNVG